MNLAFLKVIILFRDVELEPQISRKALCGIWDSLETLMKSEGQRAISEGGLLATA